jgi:hypothetical protein
MIDLIEELWLNLRKAGLPEVMLYLPDGTASRCHWDNTALVGSVRVALLGDQERGIVRVVPVSSCTGLGIASPKGTDPNGYRAVVLERIASSQSLSSVPAETHEFDQALGPRAGC